MYCIYSLQIFFHYFQNWKSVLLKTKSLIHIFNTFILKIRQTKHHTHTCMLLSVSVVRIISKSFSVNIDWKRNYFKNCYFKILIFVTLNKEFPKINKAKIILRNSIIINAIQDLRTLTPMHSRKMHATVVNIIDHR